MTRIRLLLACSAISGCAALIDPDPGGEARAALADVRSALGVGAAGTDDTVLLRGRIAGGAEDATFEHVYGPGGAFRRTRGNERPMRIGHDGETTWKQDAQEAPRTLALGAAAEACFRAWLEGGAWANAELGAFRVRASDVDAASGWTMDLSTRDGFFEGRVWIDPDTALPTLIEQSGPHGVDRTHFADWRLIGSRRVAFEIVNEAARGQVTEYRVDSAELVGEPALDAIFKPTAYDRRDTDFDLDRSARVPARLLATGHVMVQATLDERPAAWFLLDTGAGRNLIDADLTSELGWEAVGGAVVAGTGGEVQARLLQGDRLRLGPATIRDLPWVELDLDFLERILGVPVAGVLGYDLFARAVVEIDWALGNVALFDPEVYPAPDASWEELLFDDTAPCIQARFAPGKEGWFRLDTGSDDTVAFHTSTVRALGLGARIDGARAVQMEGVGGQAHGQRGRLDWFELGDLRFHGPRVTLVDAGWGSLDDPYLAGNLGTGFLRSARIILHYPARRVLIAAVRVERVCQAWSRSALSVGTGTPIR